MLKEQSILHLATKTNVVVANTEDIFMKTLKEALQVIKQVALKSLRFQEPISWMVSFVHILHPKSVYSFRSLFNASIGCSDYLEKEEACGQPKDSKWKRSAKIAVNISCWVKQF